MARQGMNSSRRQSLVARMKLLSNQNESGSASRVAGGSLIYGLAGTPDSRVNLPFSTEKLDRPDKIEHGSRGCEEAKQPVLVRWSALGQVAKGADQVPILALCFEDFRT